MNQFLEKHNSLKLQIELVPRTCWYSNVRTNIPRNQWNNIRKQVYRKANYICEICGGRGTRHPVECHEVWEYDDIKCIQKLAYFQALCPDCHLVKHYGFAVSRNLDHKAINIFCKINNININEFDKIIIAVYEQWESRSQKEWTLDLSLLEKYKI